MQAMELKPNHRIVTIGSGGCNMLAYLSKALKPRSTSSISTRTTSR